ncbi:MAG: hypothetical protein PHY77_02590, partial [Desulfotomaculaceae bacterium]|nr:hypothetical protein [Desulfotomaculaceae bacterium]
FGILSTARPRGPHATLRCPCPRGSLPGSCPKRSALPLVGRPVKRFGRAWAGLRPVVSRSCCTTVLTLMLLL